MSAKHMYGYLEKIAYHMSVGNPDKVSYFTNRQIETYGPLLPSDMHLLSQLVNIKITEIKIASLKECNKAIAAI